MQRIILSGLALGAAALWTPAANAGSGATAVTVTGGMPAAVSAGRRGMAGQHVRVHHWGHRIGGRWQGGFFAPGGWMAWRQPVVGFVLPRYWIQPAFFIPNHSAYGLAAPPYGYGWSRYYDDAVLTDRHGRVRDSRSGIRWDEINGSDRVGGHPHHDTPPPRLPNYDYGVESDHGVTYRDETYQDDPRDSEYRGTWTGTWTGADGRTYSGTYSGDFHGEVDAAPAYAEPHWRDEAPPYAVPMLPYQGGYYANGYYYPAPTVTTVVVHPSVTTTTTTFIEEEVIHPAPRKTWRSKTKWRAKGKAAACACK